MRRLIPFIVAALAAGAASVSSAGDIQFGVAITGQVVPGVYGNVVIGNAPPPPVVYARPMVIEAPPPGVIVRPLYLHVPPEHARHWREHCHEYHACNRPVYFVRSAEYEPGFNMERWRREHLDHGRGHEDHEHFDHGRHGDHDRDYDRDHDRGHDKDYDRDHDRHDRDDDR
jgi:hypothetical protein